MDFTKFVSLLKERSLYFTRLDLLGDRFEGSYSPLSRSLRQQAHPEWTEVELNRMEYLNRNYIYQMFANCWHVNNSESASMWSVYAERGQGVAISTTYSRLMEAFKDERQNVMIGQMRYIDHQSEAIPEGNAFYPALHKGLFFEHERELRALIWQPIQPDFLDGEFTFQPPITVGTLANVSLDVLIETITIAPQQPDWFLKLVKSTCDAYGFPALRELVTPSQMTGKLYY